MLLRFCLQLRFKIAIIFVHNLCSFEEIQSSLTKVERTKVKAKPFFCCQATLSFETNSILATNQTRLDLIIWITKTSLLRFVFNIRVLSDLKKYFKKCQSIGLSFSSNLPKYFLGSMEHKLGHFLTLLRTFWFSKLIRDEISTKFTCHEADINR